jgi:hypothetical protein
MKQRTTWLVLILFLCVSAGALAQDDGNNDLGFTLGVEAVPRHELVTPAGGQLEFSKSVVFGVNYARRLTNGRALALYLEFPFSASPSHRIHSDNPATITNLATLFITPSIRTKLLPRGPVSPWLSGGFGYGLLEGDKKLPGGALNPVRHTQAGTLQFGGGVDIRTPVHILAPIALRFEVRDFYMLKTLNYNTAIREDRQHHVVIAGGFVLRF